MHKTYYVTVCCAEDVMSSFDIIGTLGFKKNDIHCTFTYVCKLLH